MMIEFIVPGEPTGKGRPRVSIIAGHANLRTPEKTVLYENNVRMQYQLVSQGYKFNDQDQLLMRIDAFFQIPQSASKKKKELMISGGIRPTKKPDMDNILKVVADALNGVAYRDDTQIVTAGVHKFYSDNPRVEVLIRSDDDHET
jgi:Holliday junction resolvase RusA-like endonuclease